MVNYLSRPFSLLVATENHFLYDTIISIPGVDTLFTSYNLFIVLILFIILPLLNWLLNKVWGPMKEPNMITWQAEEENNKDSPISDSINITPAIRIENSQAISLVTGVLGIAYIIYHFITRSFDLDLNIFIFIF